ncbi:MAG: hypothetical protein LBJ48_06960 [Coriobacteriales bacterium]|jgi:hypothetical protein|nr:hypothetical protein [Coriobacteriales bacterium]
MEAITRTRSKGLRFFFEHVIFKVSCVNFWKRVITYTLLMAVIGHLIENVYTGIGFLLGSFAVDDPNYVDIWLRPLKPMWVYSVCTLFFFFIIIPIKEQFYKRIRSKVLNVAAVFVAAFLIAFLTELIMGLLLNQPSELGHYPLWDFTNYDWTVLDQAYLINDFWYAVLITVCAFVVFPLVEHRMARLQAHTQTVVTICSILFVGALFDYYLPTYLEPWPVQGLS